MTNFNVTESIMRAHQIKSAMLKSFDVDFTFNAAFNTMIFSIEYFLENPSDFFANAARKDVTMACVKGEAAMKFGAEKELTSQALTICYAFRDAMSGNSIAGLIAQEN